MQSSPNRAGLSLRYISTHFPAVLHEFMMCSTPTEDPKPCFVLVASRVLEEDFLCEF